LGVRPSSFEDASLAEPGWPRMPVTATVTELLGSEIHVLFGVDAPPVQHDSLSDAVASDDGDAAVPLAGGGLMWTARVAARSPVRPGRPTVLAVDTSGLQFFDPATRLPASPSAPRPGDGAATGRDGWSSVAGCALSGFRTISTTFSPGWTCR